MANVLFLTVLVPIIAALLVMCLSPRAHAVIKGIGLLGALIPALFALLAYVDFHRGGISTGLQYPWAVTWLQVPNAWLNMPLNIQLAFGADGISLPLVLLTGVVSVLAAIRSFKIEWRVKAHYFWQMLLVAGLYGVFAASDLFTFFFFLEWTLVACYFLIGIWGNERRHYAATKFLIYRGVASVVLLAGFIGLAYEYAAQALTASSIIYFPYAPHLFTLSIGQLLDEASRFSLPSTVQGPLFLVFLLAVLIEEAFVPFHTWLPDTHEQSDTSTNMLIGGVLMKVGLYVLLRFAVEMLPEGLAQYGTFVGVLGVISILYGAFAAIAQKDWRRLIAFSSISHMGLVLLAIASMNVIGLQGAVFMLVSSGLLTALLFYTVGAQAERTKSFTFSTLGGLSKSLPVISGVLLVAALGSVGLPGLSGFISEFSLFVGSFAVFPWLSAVATLGMIFAALYLLYAMQRTTFGPQRVEYDGLVDARASEWVPLVVLVALVVWIGVYPAVLGDVVHGTVQAIAARIGG